MFISYPVAHRRFAHHHEDNDVLLLYNVMVLCKLYAARIHFLNGWFDIYDRIYEVWCVLPIEYSVVKVYGGVNSRSLLF